jgi:eukaryotic-like serine/threonine-protein kinase
LDEGDRTERIPDSGYAPTLMDSRSASNADSAAPGAGSVAAEPPAEEQSKVIGPYRLIRKLGDGGMGQVWLAEQTEPVRRQVALKLIRAGMYDDEVVQRFRAERQSLAMMDHPSIAKVFDAGATPDGQPYFVMEYVPGVPITRYCDEKRLTVRQRLELFIKVCEGVQHAHQKAMVHRDLKPANILVAEVNGKPVPRIIDFGLAKATTPVVGSETMFTRVGSFVGTPGYMSPEQAGGSGDVDTRTDVYSLGVVLYALLAGDEPFDSTQWANQPFHEVLRQLQEYEPATPSTRIRSDQASLAARAGMRSAEPRQLEMQLRGDLDWITMKALEKDRERRYGSPVELAEDISRYLDNQPVKARPASTGYRVQKYVRRHRAGVVVASGLVLLLAAFAVVEAVQVRRVTRERDRANRITAFLQQIFQVNDPSQARGNTITARELLDRASKEIDTGLAGDPEEQAQMLDVMGNVYTSLGLYDQAEPLVRRSLAIRQKALGAENPATLASMDSLAYLLHRDGRDADAESVQREALEIERRVLRPKDPRTVNSMSQLAGILADRGHYPDAEKLNREVLDLDEQIDGPESQQAIMAESHLGDTLLREGHDVEAEKLERQALESAQRVMGSDNPETLRIMGYLGEVLQREAHYREEEQLLRQTVEIQRRVLGPDHPHTLQSMETLAAAIERQGRHEEAEKLQRTVVQELTQTMSPDSRSLLVAKSELGSTLLAEKRYAEAEAVLREVVDADRRALGPDHPDTQSAVQDLANTLMEAGSYTEAESLYRQVLAVERRVLRPDHPDTAITLYNLGCVTAHEGRRTEAISFLTEAVDHGLSAFGDRAMARDPDLQSLHGDSRFTALVARAQQVAQAKSAASGAH